MPRLDRILVRYRLPQSDQWSDLRWCEIEKNAIDGGIQVRVAPATGRVMPADSAFEPLTLDEARKLLVWDITESGAPTAYCFVLKENNLYRFSFDMASKCFAGYGQCWSLETHDPDASQASIKLLSAFNTTEIDDDSRLAMRTRDSYNYKQLTEVAENLAALRSQYSDWQQKVILERQQQEALAADAEAKEKEQLRLRTERQHQIEEAQRKKQEAALRVQPDVVRAPDPSVRDRLYNEEDPDLDAAIALQLQINEMVEGEDFPSQQNRAGLSDEAWEYEDVCRLGRAAQQNVPSANANGGPLSFFPAPARRSPPRRPPAQFSHLFLALTGAALCAYGISIAFTSPWVGIGLIAIGALCVCAAMLGRFPPPQNRPDGAALGAYRMM